MGATTTELMVRLVADTKGFATELSGATRDIDALETKALRMGTAMQDVGRRMTLGFTLPVVAGMGLAVKAASDLQEAQSKSNTIFAGSSAAINRWASGAAKDFGLSTRAALDNAASFGNMFSQLGIGGPQVAKMSRSMVELAADFASFHNADITEVLLAQQAAFRGEYDALQRFVPTINAAAVETKALAMTGKENAKELTHQEKAMAAYTLMVEGAGEAMGDFDRTADGAANQMRTAQASLENAAASLGSVVLPMFADLVGVLADVAEWFAQLPDPVKNTIVVLGGLVAAAGPVLWVTGSMVKNVAVLADTFPKLGSAAAGAVSALGSLAAPALAVGITAVAIALIKSTNAAVDYERAAKAITRAQDDMQARMFVAVVTIEKLTGGLAGAVAPARLFAEVLEQGVGPAERLIKNLQAAGYNTDVFENALRQEIAAQKQANADTERGQQLLGGLGGTAAETATEITDLKDAFDQLIGSQFDVEQASISMEQALNDLNTIIREGKQDTLEGRQAHLDAKQSIAEWGEAIAANYEAAGATADEARAFQLAALSDVANMLAPGSTLRVWLDEYVWRLATIPREVKTRVAIEQWAANFVAAGGSGHGEIAFGAEGAIVNRPTVALIGEAGPEVLIPLNRLPGNQPLPQSGIGGASSHMTFNIYDATDPERVMNAIARAVANGAAPTPRVRAAFAG